MNRSRPTNSTWISRLSCCFCKRVNLIDYDDLEIELQPLIQTAAPIPPENDDLEMEVLRGNLELECPPTAKIVRIFTSSTFTDTEHERNYLMENSYPELKKFCQDRGYAFQIVDMRWGVRDEATDDHMTTELCLKEIDLCNKLSTGPSFVTFLSHKYGYRDLPREIIATEYDKMIEAVETQESKTLINRWFKRDDNAVPPTYVLQSVSSRLPDFMSANKEKKESASNTWYYEREKMRKTLASVAANILPRESAHRYIRSVTDAEIDKGIKQNENQAFWFYRNIDGIDNAKPSDPSDVLNRYIECSGNKEDLSETKDLIQKLKEKLELKLPKQHILHYPISWVETGVDPKSHKPHLEYIKQLSGDFEKVIKKSISEAIDIRIKKVNSNPSLFQEVCQHIVFCQEKCKAFYGRKKAFNTIEQYIRDVNNREPLIVHGESGCGKTSIMAMAAKKAWQTVDNITIIIRFLGTTPDSSNIGALLLSITNQIRTVYNQEQIKSDLDIKELSEKFDQTIKLATRDRPLVVILDSLDQLDAAGGARQLSWLPEELPENVKLIVSTLPEDQYGCFPILKGMFANQTCFLRVTTLSPNDVEQIITMWLESKHRNLQENQRKLLIDAFNQCALPLYLKLAFDEVCCWKSYTPPESSVLKLTVREIINDLFTRVESLHGKLLVSRALGYLTLSVSGLTEAELEDILSCDDDVLDDVYQYWTPPIRRLPPLLLVRIKAELGQYFVDRGADGVTVFYWYHRQFIEAARDRYCSDNGTTIKMNGVLADYFSGVWANGEEKSYTTKSGEMAADRFAAAQPYKLGESYNLRKLNHLPHHRLEADQKELLKSECLCNYEFIFSKLKASGLRSLLDDFVSANDDREIGSVFDALRLSAKALQNNLNELPSQLIGRLKETQGLVTLLQDCRHSENYFLLPNKSILVQPGGPLVHSFTYHKRFICGLDINKTGEEAATCSDDKTIKLFSVKSGVLLKSYDVEDYPNHVRFCNHDKTLVVKCGGSRSAGYVYGVSIETDISQFKIPVEDEYTMCVCGPNNTTLAIFTGVMVKLYSTETGQKINEVENMDMRKGGVSFGGNCLVSGREDYVVITDRDAYRVIVFDVKNFTFLHIKYIYSEYEDKDSRRNKVDALVITTDQKYVLVSSEQDNDILFYNIITMEHVRTIKGNPDDKISSYWTTYQISADGRFLYFTYSSKVIVYNLESGVRSIAVDNLDEVRHVSSLDINRFVTVDYNMVTRIWDCSRMVEDQPTDDDRETGKIVLTDNSRFTATMCKVNNDDVCFQIEVFDLLLNKVIQTHKLVGVSKYMLHIDGTKFLVKSEFSVAIIDLASSEVVKLFQSILSGYNAELFCNNTKFVVFSRGRKNLKVYDIESGSCDVIEGFGHRMTGMVVNKSGNRFVSTKEKGTETGLVVFDLLERKRLYVYKTSMIPGAGREDDELDIDKVNLTEDGMYLIHCHEMIPPCMKDRDEKFDIIVVWDIKQSKVHEYLQDEEYIVKYKYIEYYYAVKDIKILNQTSVMSVHYDGHLRIFNYHDGTLLRRLLCHTYGSDPVLKINNMVSFFLSVSCIDIQVWDKDTLECIVSYSFDKDIDTDDVCISSDGSYVIIKQPNGHPNPFYLLGGPANSKYKPALEMKEEENTFLPLDTISEIVVPRGELQVGDIDKDPPDDDTDSDDYGDDDDDNDDDSDF